MGSLVVISHDFEVIKELTSKVATMYCGRIVEMGYTAGVLSDPCHCYTRGLLNSSPGLLAYRDLWGISGEPAAANVQGCAFYPRCNQREESCKESKPELRYVASQRLVACHKGGIETLLEVRGLKRSFERGKRKVSAVNGADLKVRSGEVLALVGRTGSGKSTLARLLVGVHAPESGEIIFRGKKVKGRWPTKMFGGMQMVFQDPFAAVNPRFNVLEAVKEPLDIIKWGTDEKRLARVKEVLELVQLPGTEQFLNLSCRELSGGQLQRVAIARALVAQPRLLIADEITSMLDPSTQANLLRRLKELQNDFGFAMLFITHDLYLARKIADRVCVMQDGRIIKRGMRGPINEKIYNNYA